MVDLAFGNLRFTQGEVVRIINCLKKNIYLLISNPAYTIKTNEQNCY